MRTRMTLAAFALLLTMPTAGCDETPQDVINGIAFGLDMGALVSEKGVDFAVQRNDFPGCIVAGCVTTLAKSGADVLGDLDLEGKKLTELPAITVDLKACGALIGGFDPVAPEAITDKVAELWEAHGAGIIDKVEGYVDKSPKLGCYEKHIVAAFLAQFNDAVPQIATQLGAPTAQVFIAAQPVLPCQ